MTISGGIKFFKKSRSDIDDDNVIITASSGEATKNNIRDRVRYLKWISIGSDDVTTETLEIDFGALYDIDRLLLVKHNFKNFQVEYDNSGWTDFANVVTKEGTQANIQETGNTKVNSYYEFDSVNTQKIRISMDTTLVVDDEKELFEVVATEEIGTFTGYPQNSQSFSRNAIRKQTARGRVKYSILDESYTTSLTFDKYPTAVDHTTVLTLWNDLKEFLIYPCGGNEDQFRFEEKGYRLEDIYLVWFSDNFNPNYEQNVYVFGLNYTVALEETA